MVAEPHSLAETGRLVIAYRGVELELFSRLGSWVEAAGDAEGRLHLEVASRLHGRHATWWEAEAAQLAPAAPGDLAVGAFELLGSLEEASSRQASRDEAFVVRLGVFTRLVLPRLVATYRAHRTRCTEVADGQTAYVLDHVLADELRCWQEAEALVEARLTPASARSVSELAGHLEAELLSRGVPLGLLGEAPAG